MFGKKKLIAENKRLHEWVDELTRPDEFRTVGVLTVEIPLNLTKEKTDEILKMVQERMDGEMERIGTKMDWIIMPSIIRSVQTITIQEAKE